MNIAILFQSIPQLKKRYDHDAHFGILGNCDFSVFMGTTDPVTAEFVSSRAGTASIVVETEMEEHNKFDPTHFTAQRRESQGVGKRELLTPDEVLTMGKDDEMTEIIIMRGQPILICEKYDYKRDPETENWEPFAMQDFKPTDSFWFDDDETPAESGSEAEPESVSPQKEPAPATQASSSAGSLPQRPQAPTPVPSQVPVQVSAPGPSPVIEPVQEAPAVDGERQQDGSKPVSGTYSPTDYVEMLTKDMEIQVDSHTGEVVSESKRKRSGTAYKNNNTII